MINYMTLGVGIFSEKKTQLNSSRCLYELDYLIDLYWQVNDY